jgi:ABC-type transport system involved in Fe-S cluster assembly fused permease/ATPase subunit
MPTDVGPPPHDRVRLSPAERRAIADLEQHLADEQQSVTRLGARLQRGAGSVVRWLYIAAPWVLPIAAVVTILTATASTTAGAVCALVTAVLLLLTLWRILLNVAERRAAEAAKRSPRHRPA